MHLENNYEEGEMISGLVSEKALDSLFPPSFWRGETELIIGIIDKMHEKLRKVHWKLINSVYNYKDMSKFWFRTFINNSDFYLSNLAIVILDKLHFYKFDYSIYQNSMKHFKPIQIPSKSRNSNIVHLSRNLFDKIGNF